MRTFEVGKRYTDGAMTFEIVARTAKTIKYAMIQHAGRENERRCYEKKAKINNWEDREIFFTGHYEVEA